MRVSMVFHPECNFIFVHMPRRESSAGVVKVPINLDSSRPHLLDIRLHVDVIIMTSMRRRPKPHQDAKTAALRASGTLHPHPEAVGDEAFSGHEFFDRRDRVQVKYEMLRSHRVAGRPVTEVADSFGVSRQAFYTAERGFQAQGIAGILPRPRGPKRAHKCTDEVLDFVEQWSCEARDSQETAAQAVARRFGVWIHPRSLDRALVRRKKKRRTPPRGVS